MNVVKRKHFTLRTVLSTFFLLELSKKIIIDWEIHIFVLTDCKNNLFQKKNMYKSMNIRFPNYRSAGASEEWTFECSFSCYDYFRSHLSHIRNFFHCSISNLVITVSRSMLTNQKTTRCRLGIASRNQ